MRRRFLETRGLASGKVGKRKSPGCEHEVWGVRALILVSALILLLEF